MKTKSSFLEICEAGSFEVVAKDEIFINREDDKMKSS